MAAKFAFYNWDTGQYSYGPWLTYTARSNTQFLVEWELTKIPNAVWSVGVWYTWRPTGGSWSTPDFQWTRGTCWTRSDIQTIVGGSFTLSSASERRALHSSTVLAHDAPGSVSADTRCFGELPSDAIVGTQAADTILGTPRADVIVGLGGADTILGGNGKDWICGGRGGDKIAGERQDDSVSAGKGRDTVIGMTGRDSLAGGQDSDIIAGGDGNDLLRGGGDGLDILSYRSSRAGVSVNFNSGLATGQGIDRFGGFNAVVGSQYDDSLYGSARLEIFVPFLGNDEVDGGVGPDALYYLLGDHRVTVDLSSREAFGEGHDYPVSGIEILAGSDQDDTLTGTPGYEFIFGLRGSDVLDGQSGGDSLIGGAGRGDKCVNGSVFLHCENQSSTLPTPAPPSTPGE